MRRQPRPDPEPHPTRNGRGTGHDQGRPRWSATPRPHHAGAMTTTPPPTAHRAEPRSTRPEGSHGPPDDGPRVTGDEVRDLSRLRRSTTDRKVAGVAGGLARHLDIDPLILRVGFVVLAFFGGAGLILYAAIWALVPEDGPRPRRGPPRRAQPYRRAGRPRRDRRAGAGRRQLGRLLVPLAAGHHRRDRLRLAQPQPRPRPHRAPSRTGWEDAHRPGSPGAARRLGPAPAYVAPRPRDPRKRGPILFWFTLLLIAVAEGVLGIVDLAGVPGRRLGVRRARRRRHRDDAARGLRRRSCRRPDRPRPRRQPRPGRRRPPPTAGTATACSSPRPRPPTWPVLLPVHR